MVRSQSSPSNGSVDLVKVGGLEFWKSLSLLRGFLVVIATMVVLVGGNFRKVL
jgi:hypothetical protein